VKRAWMISLALALSLGGLAPAHAQIAAALGKPLPDSRLPKGTVTVLIIAGTAAQPVGGLDVHFKIGDAARTARTDAAGRANMPNVPAGATVQVTVKGSKGDVSSEAFPMPDAGGVHLLLSTEPFTGGGAAPMAGGGGGGPMAGGGGRPEPRMMSGRGRPDKGVPGGTMIVTVTYDDFSDLAKDVPVVLVGYAANGAVTTQVQQTDVAGHATFSALDRSGGTAYYAMAALPRGDTVDRAASIPIQMDATVGTRVMLSAEKRDAKKPPADDLSKLEPQLDLPDGQVVASIAGVPEAGGTVELFDTHSAQVVASAKAVPEPPKDVSIETRPLGQDGTAATGTLLAQLARRGAQNLVALPDTTVVVRAAAAAPDAAAGAGAGAGAGSGAGSGSGSAAASPAAPSPAAPPPAAAQGPVLATAVSAKDGLARLENLPTAVPLVAEVTVGDHTVTSTPFTMPTNTGAHMTLELSWKTRGQYMATFDHVAVGPTRAYLVQTHMRHQTYRSLPFLPVAGRGTVVSIVVYPRVMFQFVLDSWVEDDFLAVRGQFAVRNYSWAPYQASADGLIVPLPDGFKGQVVAETQEVGKDDAGFRILRPLPPFGLVFHAGFSLPIHDEDLSVDMPLPVGLWQGDLAVRLLPGMDVVPPQLPGVSTQHATDSGNQWFVMHNLTVMPTPSGPVPHLTFEIQGLPTKAAWRVMVPRIVGILVIFMVLIAGAIAIGAATRGRPETARTARRGRIDALYDQLVALERDGDKDSPRHAATVRELEGLLAQDRGDGPAAPEG
jgi:hypothetical protein